MQHRNTLPILDLDHFDPRVMETIWKEYGTFIVKGKAIDNLMKIVPNTMSLSKKLFELPIETLKKVDHQGKFNGFQNVLETTTDRVKKGANIPIRNQLAYTLKPDLMPERRVPEGIESVQLFDEFYTLAKKTVLHPLYNFIADAFIKPEFRSNLAEDKGSTFATRKYAAPQAEKTSLDETIHKTRKVGIPAHTDFGLLTLVITNASGLQVLTTSGEWIDAPFDPNELYAIINIGDWALFQALQSGHTQFKEGVHRVLEKDKLSLIVEFLPPYAEKIQTPKGPVVDFKTFLFGGEKAKYRDTSRDECAETVAESIAKLKPVNPIINFPLTPTLYVTENGKSGQEPWVFVNGKDHPLCSQDMIDVPEKAHDNFSYAYVHPEARYQSCISSRKIDNFARTFAINLKYANDIYVVDESVIPGGAQNEELLKTIVKTLIPLATYKGNFKNPVYLINRPLLVDEARDVTSEKSHLQQFSKFAEKQPDVISNKSGEKYIQRDSKNSCINYREV